MDYASTALILVGYQNDYFAKDGILRGVVEDPAEVDQVLEKTMRFAIREGGRTVGAGRVADILD